MASFYDPIIDEVRRHRRELSEERGSFEEMKKNMAANRARLEKEGWHFLSDEEMARLKAKHKNPPVSELMAEMERE